MNIQKIVSTLIVALFTAASIQSVAFAKAKDDDSVRSWGRWATLVQPAAGPPVANVALAGLGLPEVIILPEPPPPPVVDPGNCDAGALCGYGVIAQNRIQIFADDDPLNTINGPQLATPNLDPIPVGAEALNIAIGPDELITLTINSNSTPGLGLNFTDQGVFVDSFFPGVTFWGNEDGGAEIFGITIDVLGKLFAFGFIDSEVTEFGFPILFDETITEAAFIFGETSSIDDLAIAEINAGNVEANYQGGTLLAGTFVDIDVDFGAGTWEGSFNGGTDSGVVDQQANSDGSTSLIGQVGFDASGVISGINIVSNDISADDGIVSGSVTGSFFGGEAAVLAGSVDIDKTVEAVGDAEGYSGNYTDVFVTIDTNSEIIPELEPN